MIPFGDALEMTLQKLGLGEPAVMLEIRREWEALAGVRWSSQAVPLYLQKGVLVVEVRDRSAMAFLRYSVADLERRLVDRFGREVVQRVDLMAPTRNSKRAP